MSIESSVSTTTIKALVVSILLATSLIAAHFGSSKVRRDCVFWEQQN
jgi:hypothetical protein